MQTGQFLYTALAIWSLAAGAFLCGVYDLFRLFRLRGKQKRVTLFFCDLLFCLIAAVTMLLLFFNLSFGRARAYAFVFCGAGFLIWRLTVSRLVMRLMLRLITFAEKLLNSIKMRLNVLLFKLSRRIYTSNYCRKKLRYVQNGFGILKKRKEIKNDKKTCENQPDN